MPDFIRVGRVSWNMWQKHLVCFWVHSVDYCWLRWFRCGLDHAVSNSLVCLQVSPCRARVVVRSTDNNKTTRVMAIYTVHLFTKLYWKQNITKMSITSQHVRVLRTPAFISPGGYLLPLSLPTRSYAQPINRQVWPHSPRPSCIQDHWTVKQDLSVVT